MVFFHKLLKLLYKDYLEDNNCDIFNITFILVYKLLLNLYKKIAIFGFATDIIYNIMTVEVKK